MLTRCPAALALYTRVTSEIHPIAWSRQVAAAETKMVSTGGCRRDQNGADRWLPQRSQMNANVQLGVEDMAAIDR